MNDEPDSTSIAVRAHTRAMVAVAIDSAMDNIIKAGALCGEDNDDIKEDLAVVGNELMAIMEKLSANLGGMIGPEKTLDWKIPGSP